MKGLGFLTVAVSYLLCGVESVSAFRWSQNERFARDALPARTPDLGIMLELGGVENPAPTPAPSFDATKLHKRHSTDNTCAYVSGSAEIPLYCGVESECVYNSIRSNIGCCPDSSTTCPIWTTCLDSTQSDSFTTSNGFTLWCGNSTYPHCVTHKFADTLFFGYTLLGCGKTATSDPVYYHPTNSNAATTGSDISSNPIAPTTVTKSSSSQAVDPTQTSTTPSPGGSKTPIGPIVGGVVGGVAGLALIGAAIFFLVRHNKKKNNTPPTTLAQNAAGAPGGPGGPGGMYGQQPPPQMAQGQQYPPPGGFVPVDNRDSMAKFGAHQSVYDPNGTIAGVSPPGSPPPQSYSPQSPQYGTPSPGNDATSPTVSNYTGQHMSTTPVGGLQPQHSGGMGFQSGPVPTYHELPTGRPDGELRELA